MMDTQLTRLGFARYTLAPLLDLPRLRDDLEQLQELALDAPIDRYDPRAGRFRYYGRGVVLGDPPAFSWLSVGEGEASPHDQASFNPEFEGTIRQFADLPSTAKANGLMQTLIHVDFAQTYWTPAERQWPIAVAVQLMMLSVDHDGEAVASPNALHQDGEPYTFAHLLLRSDCEGGDNLIAKPEYRGGQPADVPINDRLAKFTLDHALDSYAIYDPRVSHYVGPVKRRSGAAVGRRAIVLIDFAPMAPRYPD